jgi:Mg2+ and Co2+ transporter CorA
MAAERELSAPEALGVDYFFLGRHFLVTVHAGLSRPVADIFDQLERSAELLGRGVERLMHAIMDAAIDAYVTQISSRLGVAMKGLTLVATSSVPFVVIGGMWGMTFEHVPLSHRPHGFWLMLALQLAIGVLLLIVLRCRRWL